MLLPPTHSTNDLDTDTLASMEDLLDSSQARSLLSPTATSSNASPSGVALLGDGKSVRCPAASKSTCSARLRRLRERLVRPLAPTTAASRSMPTPRTPPRAGRRGDESRGGVVTRRGARGPEEAASNGWVVCAGPRTVRPRRAKRWLRSRATSFLAARLRHSRRREHLPARAARQSRGMAERGQSRPRRRSG